MGGDDLVGTPTWDNHETRDGVMRLFGKSQWLLAHPSVRSLIDRTEFARYHYHEGRDLMTEYVQEHLPDGGLLAIYQDYDEFSFVMLRIRAHFVALVQSLHAIPDTCAHMIFYCLAMNRDPSAPLPRAISARTVLALLKAKVATGEAKFAGICSHFESLTAGKDYEHLFALGNTLKHRSIIRPSMSESFQGAQDERLTLQLEAFDYEGVSYQQVDLQKFIQREHDRMQPLTVNIGRELNELLRSGAAVPI